VGPRFVENGNVGISPVEKIMAQAGAWIPCSNCGARNAATDQFCSHCGYSLTQMATAQTLAKSFHTAATWATSGPVPHRITGALQSGQQLSGRYRVVRIVGKGGFGAVYEATDARFQARRVVALKEMSDAQLNPMERATAIQNFRNEADLLVPLSHPNLPHVSDFFEEDGKAYLVMEFIQGKTLEKEQEDAGGPLDERRVMNWAIQLCDVLNYLHTQQPPIVFRDMKPSNVMVTKNDQIKLIDFGIARFFKTTATKDTTSLGSRGYAPLEQYGQGQTDHRSDIYALGATLYTMLTNTAPLDAPVRRINPSLFETPRQHNALVSPVSENIILQAMAEEPDNRYQSAAEMYQAILHSGVVVQQPSQTSLPSFSNASSSVKQASGQPYLPAGSQPSVQGGSTMSPVGQGQVQAGNVQQPLPGVSRRNLLIGGAVAVAAAATGTFFLLRASRQNATHPATTVRVSGATITVDFLYSTEKDQWLQAAIDRFHKSDAAIYQGKAIRIRPDSNGSLSLVDSILNGDVKPVAWSPASVIELNQLINSWQKKYPGQQITNIIDAQPLVKSPLVFAVWEDRAQILLNHYKSIDWATLHDAMPRKWADIGGPEDWQLVKFGQTSPAESNSGLLTVLLMAYAFSKKERNLTVNDVTSPGCFRYLDVFESAVTAFGHSSATYLTQSVFVSGPSSYDIVTTYENLVLTYQDVVKRAGLPTLRPFYPGVNFISTHPFALLHGPWAKVEQVAAATIFRDFLLAVPQQQLALQYGLRPANLSVNITDNVPGNLFLSSSVRSDIHHDLQSVQYPDTTVVKALVDVWRQHYSDRQLADG
jgi:serine/threonine protein kinase